MQPLPEVTKNLLIINVLMFIAQLTFPHLTQLLALHPVGYSDNFAPYQIVTYMFLHSPNMLMHIFFNMLALFMFGRDIEYALGAKRFLLFYLATGIGAGLLHLGVQHWELSQGNANSYALTLGASGSIFGLLAAFGMLYPNRIVMLMFPPIPMKAKYFVLLFGIMELSLGFSGTSTGVAHFAHVGGAIVGFLMILFWRVRGERF